MAATSWCLLLLTAAASASSAIMAISSLESSRTVSTSCAMFVSAPNSPLSNYCKTDTSHVHNFNVLQHPRPKTTFSSPAPLKHWMRPLAMSRSQNNMSLQEQILQGARMKLLEKESSDSVANRSKQRDPPAIEANENDIHENEGQFSYYVREGKRSEIDEITDVLMNSFHSDSQPTFDSYIRRYKYNHLKMCFDAIEEADRGLFVACAVPSTPTSFEDEGEQIVGFCSVDGRAPDPSCKIEFLTPSTLAGTSPRPYLSDLGVSTSHRRRGIGEKLARACEQWTHKRGYDKLYLKVEKKNGGGIGLYTSLGYAKTNLPWSKAAHTSEVRWDTTLLMEKSLKASSIQKEGKKRTWIKNQLWKPIKESVNRYSSRVHNGPPL